MVTISTPLKQNSPEMLLTQKSSNDYCKASPAAEANN